MGNPHKGDVSFEVDGKRRALVYNMNALCELEDALGDFLERFLEEAAAP